MPGLWLLDDSDSKSDFQHEWIPKFLCLLWKHGTVAAGSQKFDLALSTIAKNTQTFYSCLIWADEVTKVQLSTCLQVLRTGFDGSAVTAGEVDPEAVKTAVSQLSDKKNKLNVFAQYFQGRQYPMLKAAMANSKKWLARVAGDEERKQILGDLLVQLDALPVLEFPKDGLPLPAGELQSKISEHGTVLAKIVSVEGQASSVLKHSSQVGFQRAKDNVKSIVDSVFINAESLFVHHLLQACGEHCIKSSDLVAPALESLIESLPATLGTAQTTGMQDINLECERNTVYNQRCQNYIAFVSHLRAIFRDARVKHGEELPVNLENACEYIAAYFDDQGGEKPAVVRNAAAHVADFGMELSRFCNIASEVFCLLLPKLQALMLSVLDLNPTLRHVFCYFTKGTYQKDLPASAVMDDRSAADWERDINVLVYIQDKFPGLLHHRILELKAMKRKHDQKTVSVARYPAWSLGFIAQWTRVARAHAQLQQIEFVDSVSTCATAAKGPLDRGPF